VLETFDQQKSWNPSQAESRTRATHVGPAGDLNDHVEDGLGLIGEEGDVTGTHKIRISPAGSLGEVRCRWPKAQDGG
jgi:hypothetical protein